MKRKCFGVTGVLAVLLALGLVLAGCDNGTTSKGEYHLQWGATSTSFSVLSSGITNGGGSFNAGSGTGWGLVKGSMATMISNGIQSEMSPSDWISDGEQDGSFEECLNFSIDGIGAPSGLKSAASSEDVPLAGIFDGGNGVTVLVYITRN
jgi:hypothetical protein